jgi:hypothetical protein
MRQVPPSLRERFAALAQQMTIVRGSQEQAAAPAARKAIAERAPTATGLAQAGRRPRRG